MSALRGGGVRTTELTFDYKIKFSEKVYTYILQKKGLGLSSFSKRKSASHHIKCS